MRNDLIIMIIIVFGTLANVRVESEKYNDFENINLILFLTAWLNVRINSIIVAGISISGMRRRKRFLV